MKKYIWISILLSGIVLLQTSCNQPKKTEPGTLSKDSLALASSAMQKYIDDGKLSGISVMVVKNNETVMKEYYGFADIESQKPIDENTIFRAFSMTKPMTATALMILFDEGKFQLDDKVSDFIPEFAETQVYNSETKTLEPQQTPMTIRHLLTHTSGLTYGWDQSSYVDSLYRATGASGWDDTLGEKVKVLAGIPLKYQPGTKWEYGVSIDVAGYLVEVISGTPLDEFMKARIFDPLQMDDTGFYVPEEKQERFALVYSPDENGKLKAPENPAADNFLKPAILISGGGGSVTTVKDYSRFAKMLLNGGELEGVRILKEETVQLMMSNQLPEGVVYENGGGYGLGGSYTIENGQYGWSGMASTFFTVDPKNNMTVLAFTQHLPFDITYALEFNDLVHKAIIQ